MLQYHPDVSPSLDSAAKFRSIQDAYEILSDAATRQKYDASRRTLDKISAATPTHPGFLTQAQNFSAVRRNASTSWQAIAADRLRTTSWQQLPLSTKKVFDVETESSLNQSIGLPEQCTQKRISPQCPRSWRCIHDHHRRSVYLAPSEYVSGEPSLQGLCPESLASQENKNVSWCT